MDAMTGTPWELKAPQIVGKLNGRLKLVVVPDFIFYRYTLDGKIEWMGDTERPDLASCRKTDSPGWS